MPYVRFDFLDLFWNKSDFLPSSNLSLNFQTLFFSFSSLDKPLSFSPCPCEFPSPLKVEKLLWWNTERGRRHASRWSFINQSAVWSPSSISHHRRGSVQKVAQAMSQGSTIYSGVYVLCESVCMVFLLTSECTIVHWFMNMCFHESCMLLYIHSLERKNIVCLSEVLKCLQLNELTGVGVYYTVLQWLQPRGDVTEYIYCPHCDWVAFVHLDFIIFELFYFLICVIFTKEPRGWRLITALKTVQLLIQ